jgi:hypothetical protein
LAKKANTVGIKRWWKNWRARRKRAQAVAEVPEKRPLREFVYLDEVSLRSLLVSQKDTIPEEVSRAISIAEEAELTGKVSAGVTTVGKAEAGARYQTSNSSTVQSSRKAIVQTLFKELRDEKDLDYVLVVRTKPVQRFKSANEIPNTVGSDSAVPASRFERGALVEIEVTLEVDPVFRLGTLISEFTAMAEEVPAMFEQSGEAGQSMLREAQPVNKFLQRLLAGLIPIRAQAACYSVVAAGGREYVVHNDAIADLDVERHPLQVVGVTEHLGYWKDIRRVLFSSGRFTVLCRVSRDGLQKTWTPVKLADLFREVAPSLVDQISETSRASMSGMSAPAADDAHSEALGRALSLYKNKPPSISGSKLSTIAEEKLAATIAETTTRTVSPSKQRQAFATVRDLVNASIGESVPEGDADLRIRQEAREEAKLPLFPSLEARSLAPPQHMPTSSDDRDERLLDVEVVAIYW